ncbi:unnamed protein product [Phytophthora fragariaefolia]|uniref:Unnamed protein product n=1 Tax=Phytophthora fragariaefolia TaxID=1490495 RepID=A0A9W6YA86_9STRA|nr:unnamed protein product [Phytophthora fragariaefolia]
MFRSYVPEEPLGLFLLSPTFQYKYQSVARLEYRDRSQLERGYRSEIETGTTLGYIWLGSPEIGTLIHSDHKIGVALHHTSVALEGLRRTGTHIPEWRVTPGPSLDDGEIDLLESDDEAEDKVEKGEDYNPHQDQDDGVDDEDEIPDDASDDGVLNVAQRTAKRRRLSQSPAGVFTPKKIKTKSPVKTKIKVGSSGKSKSGSGSSKKPRPKSGGSRRRNASTATVLAVKGPQYLDAEEYRVIESPGLGITSWMYFSVRMKPGDPTAHAPFQTQGFPDFVPNRHDLDILKEGCDGEELKAFLATRPRTKPSDTRRTEFFFHRRADFGHEVVRALEDWVDLMEENVEARWHATHWVVRTATRHPSSSGKLVSDATSFTRASRRK